LTAYQAGMLAREDEMARGLYKILTNKEYHNQLVDKGKKRVKQFTWEKTASEILEVINFITSKRTSPIK